MLLDLPQLTGEEKLPELVEAVAKLQKMVQFLMNGKIGSDNIRAKSIVAEKMDVAELSAIAANLGVITAGLLTAVSIYGSTFATSPSSYPRVEISTINNLLLAAMNAGQYVSMIANDSGSPTMKMVDGVVTGLMGAINLLGQVRISSNRDLEIQLAGGSGYNLIIPSWSQLVNKAAGQSLQTALNAKANAFSGFTGSFTVALSGGGSRVLNFSNGVLTS